MAVLLAAVAGPMLAQAALPAALDPTIATDQVAPSGSASPIEAEQINRDAQSAVGITQLPESLRPLATGDEAQLESAGGPPRTLTAEVIAAWNHIRTRGQTPTPDLIAREIGPDKLAEFLATSPAAASVLATGQEPDRQPTQPREEREGGASVKTIIPPGQS